MTSALSPKVLMGGLEGTLSQVAAVLESGGVWGPSSRPRARKRLTPRMFVMAALHGCSRSLDENATQERLKASHAPSELQELKHALIG